MIEDNGIGREVGQAVAGRKPPPGEVYGHDYYQDRINMINRLQSRTSVEVVDLKDDNGTGRGTRVEFGYNFDKYKNPPWLKP